MDSPLCKELTQDEAKELLEKNTSILLIDIRSEMDYKERHIKNAINIPFRHAFKRITNSYTNLYEVMFIYCVHGQKSEELVTRLTKFGYVNIYNLPFGIVDWSYDIVLG